jgi:carbonic anhydrase
MAQHRDRVTCACGDLVQARFDRRWFLVVAAGSLAAGFPSVASAASGDYEAMALTCIDPRFQAPVFHYLERRGLTGKYSQFTIAGASAAVVAPAFKDRHKAFWDNLAASVQLHNIKKVIRDQSSRLRRNETCIRWGQHCYQRCRDEDAPGGRGRISETAGSTAAGPRAETWLMDLDGTALML